MREAGAAEQLSQISRNVEAENHVHKIGRIRTEPARKRVLERSEERRRWTRNVEIKTSTGDEDSLELTYGLRFVGEELKAELAKDDVEGLVREKEIL